MNIGRLLALLGALGFKKGKANGVAALDNTGKVPASQLPEASGGAGVPEAPADGKTRGRKDLQWVEIFNGVDGSVWRSGVIAPAAGVGVNGDWYLNTATGEVYGPKAAGAWGSVVLTIKGADGTSAKWFAAAGVPAGGTGANGDMYLNTTTSDVYGPKAAGAWGAVAVNIKGLTGDNGTNGTNGTSSKWLVGSGVPASGTGADTDMYLNSTTSDVYGPKAAGAWGAIAANIAGLAGAAGSKWFIGVGMPGGGVGVNGDAYLDSSTGNVYGPKTAGVWGSAVGSLRGLQGTAGIAAKWILGSGVPAAGTGVNTDMYIDSVTSDVYGPKTAGAWGAIAANIKGTAGAAGSKFLVGTGVPASGLGADGDIYLNSTTSDIYGPKAAGAWGAISANIKGIQGTAGVGAKWIVSTVAPVAGNGVDGDMFLNTTTWNVYGPKAAGAWPATSGSIQGTTGAAGTSGAPFANTNATTTGTVATVLTKVSTLNKHTLTGNTVFSTPTFDTTMTAHLAAGGVVELILDVQQGATAYTVGFWSGIDYRTTGATAPGAPAASKKLEYFTTYSTAHGWVMRVGQTQ